MVNNRTCRSSTKVEPQLTTRVFRIFSVRSYFFRCLTIRAFLRDFTQFGGANCRAIRNSPRITNISRRCTIFPTCRCGSNEESTQVGFLAALKTFFDGEEGLCNECTTRKTVTTILIPVRCLRNFSARVMLFPERCIM